MKWLGHSVTWGRTSILLLSLTIALFLDWNLSFASAKNEDGEQQHYSTLTEFSAGLKWRRDGKTSKAQLFVKGDRYRIEYLGGIKTDLGIAGVIIVRLDQERVWYIYSERRLVLSVPATKSDLLPFSVLLDGEVDRRLIGEAFAGRRAAQLYDIEVMTKSGGSERYYEWVDAERQVLLKLLSQDRDWWVEYDHLVISEQPDYFFEPPLGYRKVEAQEILSKRG